LSFEPSFLLSVVFVVPEDVVLPIEVLDPIEVEDKSKLDIEFKFITLLTKDVTVLVEVVAVVVENTPSQGLEFRKFK
jgi:hypothetical protein